MTHTLTRSTREHHPTLVDFEIRGDGRTLCGIAAPFDSPAQIHDFDGRYTETIDRRAFDRTLRERGAERVKLLTQHDARSLPIGRATLLRPEQRGLYAELRVSKTDDGDKVLTLIRDGALDGLSIGFKPIRERWSPDRSIRTLLEVALFEISVVNFQAYSQARIEAVRAEIAPDLTAARRRLLQLKRDPQ